LTSLDVSLKETNLTKMGVQLNLKAI